MCVSFRLMILVSAAVHLCVGFGVVLAHFHFAVPRASKMEPSASMTMDLQPMPSAPAAKRVEARPARKIAAKQNVSLTPPMPEQVAVAAKPAPPMPHLEANPNANVRALPPEAVLSPTPPPQLDGANGTVFVLDISGSMYEPYNGATRLAFARDVLARRIRELKEGTPFAVVLYAQRACASGPLVAASSVTRNAAVRYLQREVDCGGGTNLPAGLDAAENLHTGSIVVATDGDLNDNAYSLTTHIHDILGPVEHSPVLTIIGIAPRIEAGDDRLLQTIADAQGGAYAVDDSAPSVIATAAVAAKSVAQ
jgi:hypothetical protein